MRRQIRLATGQPHVTTAAGTAARGAQTAAAFDAVAGQYDGPLGNNALVQELRWYLWTEVSARVPAPATLLDLGCGTGLDADHFAGRGYKVVAVDPSAGMVARAGRRVETSGHADRVEVRELPSGRFRLPDVQVECVYTNLGAINCVDDLPTAAAELRRVLRPGGMLIASVIGRVCPWEIAYHAARLDGGRIAIRFARGQVPVPLASGVVWTRYHTPRQFRDALEHHFEAVYWRGLGILLPPPYLIGIQRRAPRVCSRLASVDRRVGGLPLLRSLGDHFLMVLHRRD
ncbi:MAG TPA: class I SAM-dependent methyltransferase [Chloroflexota bacterium]|nr:class I SAM-dependent methyltransferase [Chloroflexota bacterium]